MAAMIHKATRTCALVGKSVALDGLNRTEFNGMRGTLGGFDDETDRRVFYPDDSTRREISVKPENAKILIRMREIDLGTIYFSDDEDE